MDRWITDGKEIDHPQKYHDLYTGCYYSIVVVIFSDSDTQVV